MDELIQFLLRHGYVVLFGVVFLEQSGVPILAAPVLLAAGALSADGRLSFSTALVLAVCASLLADWGWYQLGRKKGRKVLRWICRISLEPDSCVRRTEDVFIRHGVRALVVAKFIPGLNTAAPPMAGMLGMSLIRFLSLDMVSAVLWVCTFTGVGYLFSEQIEDVALWLERMGSWAVILAVSALACYLAWKQYQRRRFLRRLRVSRISPEELMSKLASGEDVAIVDLRHELDMEAEEVRLPGAIHILPAEIENRQKEIPRDRDVVLYCT